VDYCFNLISGIYRGNVSKMVFQSAMWGTI